ncbi:MAG: metalloendopeptidase-like rane protein [Acidimicrobiales bacterium]|nr:metalloendopeptidase-like rane protein [Acidimicrobiales bacterium]
MLLGAVFGTAQAATKAPPKPPNPLAGKIQALRHQVDEVSADEAQLLDQLDASNGRLDDLNGQVAAIDRQIAPVQAVLTTAQARLDDLSARELVAEAQLSEARSRLSDARDQLSERAIAAYTGESGSTRYADLLLRVQSFRDLVATSTYVRVVFDDQRAAVGRYDQLKHQVSDLRDSLDQERQKARAQRDVVAAQQRQLADKRQASDSVRRQAADEVAQQNGLLDQLRARKAEFQAQIVALQRQSDALAASLRARQSGQALVPSGHGVLSVPIPGAPITSGFGPRVHPIYGDVRMHTGIDFGASSGTPIRAAADGTVVSAGPLGGYGNATVIDHGNGLATLYGHQSSIIVSPGQHVSRGQVIGYVGCTGLCTGPHLHFEVRVRGTPVDPMQYL